MLYIIDSYAWVEYFMGSEKGLCVKKLLDNDANRFITVECCLAELKGWALKEEKDFEKLYATVRSDSEIVAIRTEEWIIAGEIRYHKRKAVPDFGLIDSMLLAKQRLLGCRILSGDRHFKGEKEVVYIGN